MKAMLEKSVQNEKALTAKIVGAEEKAEAAQAKATNATASAANASKVV